MATKRKNDQNTGNNLKNESKQNVEVAELQRKDSKNTNNQERKPRFN